MTHPFAALVVAEAIVPRERRRRRARRAMPSRFRRAAGRLDAPSTAPEPALHGARRLATGP